MKDVKEMELNELELERKNTIKKLMMMGVPGEDIIYFTRLNDEIVLRKSVNAIRGL